MAFIESLGSWGWFIAGVVLLALEIAVPGTFLLWLGLASLVTGALAMLLGWAWQAQWVAFALLALAAALGWWRFSRGGALPDTDEPLLNRRAERHVGHVFILDEPIANGTGRVRIDDTVWRVEGPDLPAGAHVAAVSVKGAVLVVEKSSAPS